MCATNHKLGARMKHDLAAIRRDNALPDVCRSFGVELQRAGDEFEACCPLHSENTPSFTVYPGRDGVWRYQCFGCDQKGDVIDFVKAVKGCDIRLAIEILGGNTSAPNVAPRSHPAARNVYEGITHLGDPPEWESGARVYNPKRNSWMSFTSSMAFRYPGCGYVLRREIRDGDKETPMVCWVELADGTQCWSRFPFPKPRPIYGDIGDGQVIVVEGEKCADYLREAIGRAVVSWAGGTNGVIHADWSPLAGRSVVIWPDADPPGLKTSREIARILTEINCTVRILDVGRR